MLTLTKRTGYALIALSYLAKRSSGVISARTVAEECGLPQPILTNVLKDLAHAEIVSSVRGPLGGYALAKPLETTTLYELITVMEGAFQLVECATPDPESLEGPCEFRNSCPIRSPAYRLHERFKAFLEGVTLDEVVVDNREAALMPQMDSETVDAAESTFTEATS